MAAAGIKLHSKRWEEQLETLMQGVLAATGAMSIARANQLYSFCLCERLSKW